MGEQGPATLGGGQHPEDPAVRVPTWFWVVLGLVTAGATAAFLLFGNGRHIDNAAPPASGSSPPADVVALSATTIAKSQPTGRWRAQIIGRWSLLRSGARERLDYRQQPTTWTFTAESCSSAGCLGTVSSSSGHHFTYAWDGRELVVDRHLLTDKSDKIECTDDLGGSVPISAAAAVRTYTYSFGSFVGSASRLVSRVVIEISTEFFGSCRSASDDAIGYVEDQILTKLSG
jgi:hypothetical protein